LPLYVDCIGAMNAKRILDANLEDELMRFFVWQGEARGSLISRCYSDLLISLPGRARLA